MNYPNNIELFHEKIHKIRYGRKHKTKGPRPLTVRSSTFQKFVRTSVAASDKTHKNSPNPDFGRCAVRSGCWGQMIGRRSTLTLSHEVKKVGRPNIR